MKFPNRPSAPEWVDIGAKSVRGLDLLGLRLPVQSIGYSLLDGVTTISPKVRYICMRTLLADAYRQLPGPPPDSHTAFLDFARKAEAAIALSNALIDPDVTNVIGIDHAQELLEEHNGSVPLDNINAQLAVNAYAGPTQDLGFVGIRPEGAPAVDEKRGLPLATILRESWGHTVLGRRILEDTQLEQASLSELEEFGRVCHVDSLSEAEREGILDAIFPSDAEGTALERIRTYALLLHLAAEVGGALSERHLFEAARRPGFAPHPKLLPALDGWLLYHVRDCIAVAHEAALKEAVLAIGGDGGRPRAAILADLLRDEGGLSALWRDLRLPELESPLLGMRLGKFIGLVHQACSDGEEHDRGLCRWAGGLSEWELIQARRGYGTGALLLLPLSWVLAKRRAEDGIREGRPLFDGLSLGGASRLGMKEVLLPRLQALVAADAPMADVMADLTALTVQQHLQIATARMAQDPNRDVAVLFADGDRWIKRRDYTSGRPASRISQAVGWLHQLGLIEDGGLTTEGEARLATALRILEASESA